MVARGQFLERATVIGVDGLFLEGLWHRGEQRPALLIVPPHPLTGASMDSPVCAELAFAATRLGYPTLRFNFRGAGASGGELSDKMDDCLADARAALAALRESVGHDAVAVVGYDFGALVAVELARSGAAQALALVAPPSGADVIAAAAQVEAPMLVAAGQRDPWFDRAAWGELCQRGGDPVVLVPEADHNFSVGLAALGRDVAEWLSQARR